MIENESGLLNFMDRSIGSLFRDALRIMRANPGYAGFFLRAIRAQQRAAAVRRKWQSEGLHVPPFMIVSITNRCNLKCAGCYAQALHRPMGEEMSPERLRELIAEAKSLGVSIILIAGGEPLARPEILDITADFPGITFPMFTNGTLIDDQIIAKLRAQRHVIPILSQEGHSVQTDTRRGAGIHAILSDTITRLRAAGIMFGTSLTVTRENFATVTDRDYISDLIALGCRLFFFVEYVPARTGTEHLVLTDEQRASLRTAAAAFRAELPGLFISFPGDEEESGGCLAAGRGFVHVSPQGDVEPCPFAPYSDVNLKGQSLRQALGSPLLASIRANHDQLRETKSGCALWERRDWVQSLLASQSENRD